MSTGELSLLYLALALASLGLGSTNANAKKPGPFLSILFTVLGAYYLGNSLGYMLEQWNVL